MSASSSTDAEQNLTLLEHLEELRTRLLRICAAIGLGMVVGYFLAPWAIDLLLRPIVDSGIVAPRETRVARMTVDEQGRLAFFEGEALLAEEAAPDDPGAEAQAPTHPATPLRLSTIEIYREGRTDAPPVAVLESPSHSGVVYLRPMDPFLIRLKTALILGLVLVLPVIVREIYAFITPGLYAEERRALYPIVGLALILFPVGAAFAYFMLKFALIFFAGFASEQAYLFNDIRAYLSLALTTMLAFGVMFELPVVILTLTRLGVVSVDTLASKRKYVFLAIVIAAAFATPTGDPVTLMALTLPLYGLFELSLLVGRATSPLTRRRSKRETDA